MIHCHHVCVSSTSYLPAPGSRAAVAAAAPWWRARARLQPRRPRPRMEGNFLDALRGRSRSCGRGRGEPHAGRAVLEPALELSRPTLGPRRALPLQFDDSLRLFWVKGMSKRASEAHWRATEMRKGEAHRWHTQLSSFNYISSATTIDNVFGIVLLSPVHHLAPPFGSHVRNALFVARLKRSLTVPGVPLRGFCALSEDKLKALQEGLGRGCDPWGAGARDDRGSAGGRPDGLQSDQQQQQQ